MRYPQEHKQQVRGKILAAAARALRRHGLDAVSIPALMKQVGLTHGGFYAHFRSRDELVAEALRVAADETADGVFAASGSLDALLDRYLSSAHVRHPERGCVVAALGADAPRQSPTVQRSFAEIGRAFLARVQRKLGRPCSDEPLTGRALAVASQMVGAVVLSRLVDDPALAERILHAARAHHP
jgi:TetR/AcrR family transcriptional repressor of nem operon